MSADENFCLKLAYDPGFEVFPTREIVLVQPAKGQAEPHEPQLGDWKKPGFRIARAFDTSKGVFIEQSHPHNKLHRYQRDGTTEVLSVNVQSKLKDLKDTKQGLFILLEDAIYKFGNVNPHLHLIKTNDGESVDDPELEEAGDEILVLLGKERLYRLSDDKLTRIEEWRFGGVSMVWATSDGVLLRDSSQNLYHLNKQDHIKPIEKVWGHAMIGGVYMLSIGDFVGSTDGLFAYSQGSLRTVGGGATDNVRSIHETKYGAYVLTAGGVFRLDKHGEPRVELVSELSVKKPGVHMPDDSIFFIGSDNQGDGTFRLVAASNAPVEVLTTKGERPPQPRDITKTGAGLLLAAKSDHLYWFARNDQWIRVPSEPLGRRVVVVVPNSDGGKTAKAPIYVASNNGVFRWENFSVSALKAKFRESLPLSIHPNSVWPLSWSFEDFSCDEAITPELTLTRLGKVASPSEPLTVTRTKDSSGSFWTANVGKHHTEKSGSYVLQLAVTGPDGNAVVEKRQFNVVRSPGGVFDDVLDAVQNLVNAIPWIWKLIIALGLLSVLRLFLWDHSVRMLDWFHRAVRPTENRIKIFISYRRTDSELWALILYNEFRARFHPDLIFFDRGDIKEGDPFPCKIRKAVEQCGILLAIIGPTWLNAKEADGRRRLDDPKDFVREEIRLALKLGKIVVPILVGDDAVLPKADDLPEPIKRLANHDAMTMKAGKLRELEIKFEQLVERLADAPGVPPPKGARARRRAFLRWKPFARSVGSVT